MKELANNDSVSEVGLDIALAHIYCKYDYIRHHSSMLDTNSFNNIIYISDIKF